MVFNSVNLLIASSFEAIRKIVVQTAPQAFTLTPSIKAEKLNSAIEKKHWISSNGLERASFTGRWSGAHGGFQGATDWGNRARKYQLE
jgi:hypothetical protein